MPDIARPFLAAILALGVGAAMSPAHANEVVNASLVDKGTSMDMPMNLGVGMGGDMKMATMSIDVDKTQVKAGEVTFKVTNNSKETIHEMLVLRASDLTKPLPFIDSELRVNEETAGDLGEVSELDPGKSGSLSLDLEPGAYILTCNIPGHHRAGMWTVITVQ